MTRQHVLAGRSADDARRAALAEVGGADLVKEAVRDVHPLNELHLAWRDVSFGARSLRRAPGFAFVVIATLALGIGAAVAMFSVMHAVMWRALPYPDSDRLVVVNRTFGPVTDAGVSAEEAQAIRSTSRTLTHLGSAQGVDAFIAVDDRMERVNAASVTDDVLPLLGGGPVQLGRPLESGADVGTEWVRRVVISDRVWRRMFHGDPNAIGRRVQVNNLDVEIAGVLRPNLRVWLPLSTGVAEETDVWFPNPFDDGWPPSGSVALARLVSGVTLAQAQAELDGLARRSLESRPEAYVNAAGPLQFRVRPLQEVVAAPVARGLWALGVSVVFVLLIGCVNIANLMLVRGSAREREMAVRVALGASRARLIRQSLAEHLVLAAAGTGLGLLLAWAGIRSLESFSAQYLPRHSGIAIDGMSVAVAVGLTVGVLLACGLVPALRWVRPRPAASLVAARTASSAPHGRRMQRVLVIAEVALSIAPLVAAGLMVRTFVNLSQAPLGFDPSNVLTANVGLSLRLFPDVASKWEFYRRGLDAVSALPGVEAVSAAAPLPFERTSIRRFRRDDIAAEPVPATQQSVLPGYVSVMRTPLVAGRDFTVEDITSRRDVAIVDEYFAHAMWGDGGLGRRFLAGSTGPSLEVIGITRHIRMMRVLDAARTSVRDEGLPQVLLPYHLHPVQLTLVARTRGDAAVLAPLVKRAVEATGTQRAVYDIRPMTGYVSESLDSSRFALLALTAFAATSLLLAAVGLYGTLAYLIARRTREFGVRLALGASAGQIVGLVLREGALLTAVGAGVGVAGALVVARALRSLLYGVSPLDPMTLAGVAAAVAAVAVAAVCHPACRAMRLDPNRILRAE